MRVYMLRRLLLAIPTVFLVSLIVFFMIRFIPGSAIDAAVVRMGMVGGEVDISAARAKFEHALGLDVPPVIQYGRWIGVLPGADGRVSGLLQGDLGHSYWKATTVLEEIAARWPVTLELGLMGLFVGQLIALPIGILSALRQDTWADYIARSFAILCISVPGFWIGTVVIVFPAIWWGYMPPIMHVPFVEDPLRNIRMFIVPATILGMAMAGGSMRMTRTMMLEVLRQDYVRTAWAKGLRERLVVLRHGLKNALIPVVTYVGLWLPVLIGGTVIIERIFALQGMGYLIVDATEFRDYPIMSGVMLLFGLGMVIINLLVDITYGFLQPRVQHT